LKAAISPSLQVVGIFLVVSKSGLSIFHGEKEFTSGFMISLGAYASWIGSILDEILRTEGHCSTGTVKTEFSIGFFEFT